MQIPHADQHVVSGYSVIGVEVLEQLAERGIDPHALKGGQLAILSPLGSGGVASGMLETTTRHPAIHKYSVAAPPAVMSYKSLLLAELIREH
jgi:threonine dehydratase